MNRKTKRTRPACTLVAVVALTLQAQAATWVVGDGATADFPNVREAVLGAAAGDTIVVLPGTYAGEINVPAGKPLTIVGSGADQTTVQSFRSSAFGGGAPTALILRGLRIRPLLESATPPLGSNVPPIDLGNGANLLLIEDCVIDATVGTGINPVPAIRLAGNLSAAISNCELLGGNGRAWSSTTSFSYHDARPAVFIDDITQGSTVRFHGCRFVGGTGAETTHLLTPGGSGAAGIVTTGNGRVEVFGCEFTGGDTGPGASIGGDSTGVPGSGAKIDGPTFQHQDSQFASGTDPTGTSPSPPTIDLQLGVELPMAGEAGIVAASGKTPVGQIASVSIDAAPGSNLILLIGKPLPISGVPGVLGFYGLHPPLAATLLGVQPPSGNTTISSLIPPLPVGFESFTIAVQVMVIPSSGQPLLTNVSVATVVVNGL